MAGQPDDEAIPAASARRSRASPAVVMVVGTG
jgi:hypothetical protein